MQVKKRLFLLIWITQEDVYTKQQNMLRTGGWGELRLFEEKIKRQVYKNECFTLTEHDKQHAYFP